MHSIRELGAFHLRGKTVLVRVDFNVEHARDALRLERSLPTLRYLHRQGAIVLLVSHRGRPGGQPVPELSLRFAVRFLRERLTAHTDFIHEFDWYSIKTELAKAEPGHVFLLENIRFLPGEESERISVREHLAGELAACADIFVNDAFAVSHRIGASITEVPKLIPSYAGLLIEEELSHLGRTLTHAHPPFVVMIGGGKAKDKFVMLKHLHRHVQHFLVGGVLANTFLAAQGMQMNSSSVDEDLIHEVKKYLHDPKIVLPVDFIRNHEGRILDIGPESVKVFGGMMSKAKTIIWNGPLGHFEDPRYRAGTRGVARAIMHSRAFSVVGGGETTQFLLEERMDDKFSFLSTGGTAMLEYLSGKQLPGLEVLK